MQKAYGITASIIPSLNTDCVARHACCKSHCSRIVSQDRFRRNLAVSLQDCCWAISIKCRLI